MNRWALSLLITCAACGPSSEAFVEGDEASELETAEGPLLGADGKDAAERSCAVVLRSVTRGSNTCLSGVCWWSWTALVDVSTQAVSEAAKPKLLLKNQDASAWTSVSGTKTTGAPAGFQRYKFKLARDGVRDGMSATAYSRAKVELAPFLLTTSGARLFDHNRNANGLTNYVLEQSSGWAIGDDALVCRGDPMLARTVSFTPAGISQQGVLVAGESATLRYDIARLETCRGTHNGYPAWDVQAFVRFQPSGTVVSSSVRGFDSPSGVPSNSGAKSVPFTFEIPAGTTSLETWFQNFTGAGSSCQAWDSNFGANYSFPVSASAPARPQWAGNAGSSFSRACARGDGVPASTVLDSYVQQRACAFVEVDVWAPGFTDAGDSGLLFAQVDATLDGVKLAPTDLRFVGRVGNDWRFHFEVPKSDLFYGPKWSRYEYSFRFSTDGRAWLREGVTRAVVRDASFCNPAWPSGC
ncbi:MAG: DUF6209 family protein [Myxococcaceae bacterium]